MIKLNQSTVKDVNRVNCCPAKYKAYNIDKLFSRPTSKYMLYGQYFEWMCLGTRTRNGKVPFIPKLKKGGKPVAQLRIEEQVKVFHDLIRKRNIRILATDVTSEAEFTLPNGRKVVLFGTQDILVEEKGKLGIIDLKLSADINSSYGVYAWGNEDKINKIQPSFYKYIRKTITGIKHFFEFWVFDYKPEPEHLIHPAETTWEDVYEMTNEIQNAIIKLEAFEREGYPAIGDPDECKNCSVKNCLSRVAENKLKRNAKKDIKRVPMGKGKETILFDTPEESESANREVDPFCVR